MMKFKTFLENCDDITLHKGAPLIQLDKLKKLNFSKEHIELLSISNGLEFYGGYYRLFGVDEREKINLFSWNLDSLWKEVWGECVSGYYFFGMSAIGDLFAYKLENEIISNNEIYYLDGITMDVIDVYGGFEDFFEEEFVNRYKGIVESIFVSARRKFGNLDINTSLIYSPSLFLLNDPSVDNLMKMSTLDVMTINGDLCRQLSDSEESVKLLENYIDDLGRARVKVIFEG